LLFIEKTTAARANETNIFTRVDHEDGQEYLDEETGVSLTLPLGWRLPTAVRWGNQETTAYFNDRESKPFGALYFRIFEEPLDPSLDATRQRLREEVGPKATQRIGEGLSDYRIDAQACRERTIGGRPALSCVGEYTQDGQPMVEYLTWVDSGIAFAQFFGRNPAANAVPFITQFDVIIETLKIP